MHPSTARQPACGRLGLVLAILRAEPRLCGVIVGEGADIGFADVLAAANERWGCSAVRIVPHSADPQSPAAGTWAAHADGPTCFLLPNAHLHGPSLLDALMRRLEAGPSAVFVAVYHAREGSPHPLLLERAAVHLPAPPPLATGPLQPAGVYHGTWPDDTEAARSRTTQDACPGRSENAEWRFARLAHELGLKSHRPEIHAALFHRTWASFVDRLGPADEGVTASLTLLWRCETQAAMGESESAIPEEQRTGPTPGQTGGSAADGAADGSVNPDGAPAARPRLRPSAGSAFPGDAGLGAEGRAGAEGAPTGPAPSLQREGVGPGGRFAGTARYATRPAPITASLLPPGWYARARTSGVGERRPAPPPERPGRTRRTPSGNTGTGWAGRGVHEAKRLEPAQAGPGQVTARVRAGATIDWHATLLEAAKWQRVRAGTAREDAPVPLRLRPEDVRWRVRRQRRGALYVVILDTSASVARQGIGHAKGLTLALAEEVYARHERLALIACGGVRARLLAAPHLPPRRAQAVLAALPVGGGTPLEDALRRACRVARRHGPTKSDSLHVIVFTDGGANRRSFPAPPSGQESVGAGLPALAAAARLLRSQGARLLLVDMGGRYAAGGRGKKVAAALGAAYIPLSHLLARDDSGGRDRQ